VSSDAIAAFIRGVAKLNVHKKEIFNADTLPALKPILDVQITSNATPGELKLSTTGWVNVRIRNAFDTGQVKYYWFSSSRMTSGFSLKTLGNPGRVAKGQSFTYRKNYPNSLRRK
jgi:hypothetical protein